MSKLLAEFSLDQQRSHRRSLTVSPLANSASVSIKLNSPPNILPSLHPLQHQHQFSVLSENKILGSQSGGNIGIPADQLSEKSDEENTVAGNNFITFIRDFRLKRRALAFLNELPFRRAKRLTKRHFTLIGDPSIKYKVHQKQMQQQVVTSTDQKPNNRVDIQETKDNYFYFSFFRQKCGILKQLIFLLKQIRSKASKLLHRVPLFDYQSDKKLFWDFLYCFCSLFFFYTIPVHVAFDLRVSDIMSLPLLTASWATIFFHILITLNTCYYEKDLSYFTPLSIIMLREVNSTAVGGDNPFEILLSFLFVFSIQQYQKVVINIEERFHLSNRLTYFIQFFKLLFNLLFITHIFSCFWLYLGRINYLGGGKSWMISRSIQDDIWYVQYLHGFYFVTVTMISVGYGDIVPQTSSEIILCIIIMLISCGVFAYSVNMIGEILKNIYMQDNLVKQQVRVIGSFMAKNNINQQLRQQIRIYIEYYQRQFSEQNEKEEQGIISHLSENLKNQLMIEANKFILRESPIFSKYFSEGVIEKMVSIIKETRCTPEQIIYQRNTEKEDPKIFFIKSGLVEIFAVRAPSSKSQMHFPMHKTSVKVLKEGQSFGEYQFFTGNNNSYSARSLEFSRILYISRREFMDILKQYPQDYEKFCFIKDKIAFQRDASCINLQCYICESQKHLIENCNLTHCKIDIGKVIKQQQYIEPIQEREICSRKWAKIPWHSLIEEVRECAWRLQDDNESFIENASWMSWDSDSYSPSDQGRIVVEDNTAQPPQTTLQSQSQKNANNYSRHDFESFIQDRKGSDSFREPRKAIQLRHNYDQYSNKESTPDTHRGGGQKSGSTPSNMLHHLLHNKHPYRQQGNERNNLVDNEESSPQLTFKRSETNRSQKKKADYALYQKQLQQQSPALGPGNFNFNDPILSSQRKLLKAAGISEQTKLKSQNSLHSQSSEVVSNTGQTNRGNTKLSAFNQAGGLTPRNNRGSLTPAHQAINKANMQSPQLARKITQGVPIPQGGNASAAQQINIAELIGNQLLMNNKNVFLEKQNEENTFDVKKIYEFYYKHNNYPKVLKAYNKPIMKLLKLMQKNRLKKRQNQQNQSFVKDPKNPNYTTSNISPKKSFFRQEVMPSTEVNIASKAGNQLKAPQQAQKKYSTNLLPFPKSEDEQSMVSLMTSKNTSRSLLVPQITDSFNPTGILQTTSPGLHTDDFNFQNTRLLETLTAHAAIVNQKGYLGNISNAKNTKDEYKSEDHLKGQINILKKKMSLKNASPPSNSSKIPIINLQSIIQQQGSSEDDSLQLQAISSPVVYQPVHTQQQNYQRKAKESLKHKDSDFTTIEEKTLEYILPSQIVTSTSQYAQNIPGVNNIEFSKPEDSSVIISPHDGNLKNQRTQQNPYDIGQNKNRRKTKLQNNGSEQVQKSTGNRKEQQSSAVEPNKTKTSMKNIAPGRQSQSYLGGAAKTGEEKQDSHMQLRFDITKVLQFQDDEAKSVDNDGDSFEESNQQSQMSLQNQDQIKNPTYSSKTQLSSKQKKVQSGDISHQVDKNLEHKASIEKQIPENKFKRSNRTNLTFKRDSTAGGNKREFGNNQQQQLQAPNEGSQNRRIPSLTQTYGGIDSKKQSIRRYSRAYNMALFKRQSTQKEQGGIDLLPFQEKGVHKQQQQLGQRDDKTRSSNSSGSSPSSNNNSSNVVIPFSQALPNLQIDNFRFDMD